MPRTTPIDVITLLAGNYDTINCPSMSPYISGANVIISRVVTCAAGKSYTHTIAELREMEKWLAAYLYTITDPIYKSKQTGNSSASYFDRSYLDGAMAMDETGCLNAIMSKQRASVDWLGKPPSNQIEYTERS